MMCATIITLSYYLALPVKTPKTLYIPQGSTYKIVTYLSQKSIDAALPDILLVRLMGLPQHGLLEMEAGTMSNGDFLYRLATAKAVSRMVTLIPGETTPMFFLQLSEMYGYDAGRLRAAYRRLDTAMAEGYFVPETYALPVGADEATVVRTLGQFARETQEQMFPGRSPAERKRLITMASIIQKEAANSDEMPLIASVIVNRLRVGMPLQMDGTLNYGLYSHQKVTPERIRNDQTRYNTYKNRGLPPEPVCTVGKDAVDAALSPAKTDYLYFVKTNNGRHTFSNSYKNHLRNIKNVKK